MTMALAGSEGREVLSGRKKEQVQPHGGVRVAAYVLKITDHSVEESLASGVGSLRQALLE